MNNVAWNSSLGLLCTAGKRRGEGREGERRGREEGEREEGEGGGGREKRERLT